MNRRTLLTLSTAACLCGTYALYGVIISPLVSPGPALLREPVVSSREFQNVTSEEKEQAEKYLSHHPWTANAKYAVRNNQTLVFAREREHIADTGKIRFKPFAMIWRQKNEKRDAPPLTIVAESAVVNFARKLDFNGNPGRVIGGALEGAVEIRGPQGLSVEGRDINFAEEALRVWSDNAVNFRFAEHRGRGQGLELDLVPEPGPPADDKPAIVGVATVRLLKDVEMHLVSRPAKDGAPGETVNVASAGKFEFGVESHVASFQNQVRVVRPTGNDQFDTLSCELLTLVFEPEDPEKPEENEENPAADEAGQDSGKSPDGDLKLKFRRLRAEGPNTTVTSQRSEMEARMQELTYDDEARVIALRDAKRVRLVQRDSELFCPEVTAILDEEGQFEQATCRGAGKLTRYAKTPENAPRSRRKRQEEVTAEWLKELRMGPDQDGNLDLIELTGRAILTQTGKMALQADIVRLWVTRDNEGKSNKKRGDQPFGSEDDARKPRRMLALGETVFASPQITGQTERLEVWFVDGPLPAPPVTERDKPQQHNALRPPAIASTRDVTPVARTGKAAPLVSRTSTSGNPPVAKSPTFADVPDPARTGRGASKGKTAQSPQRPPAENKRTEKKRDPQPADNPLHIVSDVIRVRTMMTGGDVQVADVFTEGRVEVRQEHGPGEVPFRLQGNTLHLRNYSETHQVIDVVGTPAHIRDRGMQIEGATIHFDSGANDAAVEGAGVLRLPVTNSFDGKPLDRPQTLDVFWDEKMTFNGLTADFFRNVRTKLNGSELRCEEMHVTLANRISFAEGASRSRKDQESEVKLVVCRDNVELSSSEYAQNRQVEIRKAKGFEFTFDRTTGKVTALGPGTLQLWRRGGNGRAGLAGARANRPSQTETAEWEYTRVSFFGEMNGNSNEFTTRFRDRVRIVNGPVALPTDSIDEDNLPPNGNWMHCEELNLTQHVARGSNPAYIAVVGAGNAELEGFTEQGLFHALAARVSYDQSKELFSMFGDGTHDASFWREEQAGSDRGEIKAQRMDFIPSRNDLKIHRASAAQGGR